jgi:hypothetical protein
VVECFLAKEDVAGSTPVSRSKISPVCGTLLPQFQQGRRHVSPAEARYPSGKGEVCKTFMRRFDPDPRLQIFQSHGSYMNEAPTMNCGDFCGDSLHFGSISPSVGPSLLPLEFPYLLRRVELL